MGSKLSEDEIIELTQKLNPNALLRIFLTFFICFLIFILLKI